VIVLTFTIGVVDFDEMIVVVGSCLIAGAILIVNIGEMRSVGEIG